MKSFGTFDLWHVTPDRETLLSMAHRFGCCADLLADHPHAAGNARCQHVALDLMGLIQCEIMAPRRQRLDRHALGKCPMKLCSEHRQEGLAIWGTHRLILARSKVVSSIMPCLQSRSVPIWPDPVTAQFTFCTYIPPAGFDSDAFDLEIKAARP